MRDNESKRDTDPRQGSTTTAYLYLHSAWVVFAEAFDSDYFVRLGHAADISAEPPCVARCYAEICCAVAGLSAVVPR